MIVKLGWIRELNAMMCVCRMFDGLNSNFELNFGNFLIFRNPPILHVNARGNFFVTLVSRKIIVLIHWNLYSI